MKRTYITPQVSRIVFPEMQAILVGSDGLNYEYGERNEGGSGSTGGNGPHETSAKDSWNCWDDEDDE